MSEQWPITTLGEIASIKSGSGFPVKFQGNHGEQFPFYKVGDMNSEGNEVRMENSNHTISEEIRGELKAKIFPAGSIIFPKVGGAIRTNKKRIVVKDCCVDNNVMGLIPNENKVLSSYLYYFMRSVDLYDFSNKAALPSIRQSTVKDWKIPVPSLDLQQTIVNILDEAFVTISNSQNNLRNNREETVNLIKSCVDGVFSGTVDSGDGISPVVKLGEICDVITKGTTPTSVGHQFVEDGINFVKIESITTNGEFLEHKFAKITSECHEDLKRSQLRNGDILFSIAGALGRTAYVTESILPANTNQALAIIRLKKSDSVHPQYILKSLSTGFALDQIERNRAGAAQQNLSLTQMKEFEIPLPPIEVQEQISSKIDIILNNAKSLQNSIERKATGYIELKQSILQEAVTGKLTGGNPA